VRMRYSGLYKNLGLTQQQIEAFETAAAENFGSINIFGISFGMYPDDLQAQHFETHARNLDELVSRTIGEYAVAQFRQYLETADIRDVLDQVTVQTLAAGRLQEQQRDQLLVYCLAARQGPAGIRTDPSTIDWQSVIAQSASVLDAGQQAALRNIVQMRALDAEYRRITGLPYRRPVRNL